MVSLKLWMRREGVSDAEMADRVGAISAEAVRKLRFRVRGPSPRVAARIFDVTKGAVAPPDMVPSGRRKPAAPAREARAG